MLFERMNKMVQLIEEYAVFLLVLFVAGCVVSLVRELRKDLPASKDKRLKLLEWCLLPPGFAVIFVTLQQHSVRFFALHPNWTIATCLGVAALSGLLIFAQRRKRHTLLAWLGGLWGVPGVAFSLILLGLYFLSSKQFEEIRATYVNLAATPGEMAPDFGFTLLSNHEKRQLSDYRGQVVFLNIWATWCAPCLREMPDLDKLQRKFQDDGLVVIHLFDEDFEVIEEFLAKRPMVTTHGRVERRDVPEFYRFGGARPTSFLIGANGAVIEAIVGAKDLKYFERVAIPNL
jgi:thiol-disulfide isomerase/thioredoxin